METLDQFFHAGYGTDKRHHHHSSFLDNKDSQNFAVEDLLDFSKDDEQGGGGGDSGVGCSPSNSSSVTVFDCGNAKSLSGVAMATGVNPGGGEGEGAVGLGGGDCDRFSSELCVPYDDLAELEWLSNFVDESFSSEDLQKMQLISGIKAQTDEDSTSTREFQPEQFRPQHHSTTSNSPIFQSDVSVPAKARSKRPRAAPCNWASRLLFLSEPNDEVFPHEEPDGPIILTSSQPNINKKNSRAGPKRKIAGPEGGLSGEGRRCLHCATDKTPQWRTGPMGPKTLCNACGVRYKSGRLVPEYRPASSPTFVLTKHSNSHRKVLELRRQKEQIRTQHIQHQQPYGLQGQNMAFDMPSNSEDYLIHHHIGPDFQHLI